ncbi:MAG TPA: hypothetical protein VJV23_14465 [Candidatus Polarisedimenticolia bacterium]|nr:hypothetical protein [Candidatus Polarisedimenticolia bacterium]
MLTIAGGALFFADRAEAHGASVEVVIGAPVAVFGFSYGNPFLVGHVHHAPVYCAHGPLYWYPSHRVYGHYHSRYKYVRYASPRHHYPGHGWKHHDGRRHHGHHAWKRHDGRRHHSYAKAHSRRGKSVRGHDADRRDRRGDRGRRGR